MRVHPLTGKRKLHHGIDLSVPEGTAVCATADGAVVSSEWQRDYGNIIIIRHGKGFETAYAHLKKRLVQEGEDVRRGKRIGRVGRTGNATGPHLHYEVRVNGKTTDPRPYLP
jgi:murein DD-endopeptidase MepM/ murein hydrolase activator NlpD